MPAAPCGRKSFGTRRKPRGGRGIYPFETFTENAKNALTFSQEEAERAHHSYIGTEHLLLGLLRESDGLAAKVLNYLGVGITAARPAIESIVGRSERTRVRQIVPTSQVKTVIEISFNEAHRSNDDHVGTEHLLLGLLIENEGIAAQVLRQLGADLETVREQLSRMPVNEEVEAADKGARRRRPASPPRDPGGRRAPADTDARLIARVSSRAIALAEERGEMLGTEHFLLALAEQDSTKAHEIMERHGLTRLAIETILDTPPG